MVRQRYKQTGNKMTRLLKLLFLCFVFSNQAYASVSCVDASTGLYTADYQTTRQTIPQGKEFMDVLWESNQITRTLNCSNTNNKAEPIYFYEIGNGNSSINVLSALRFNGKLYHGASQTIPTGYTMSANSQMTITLTYSLALVRSSSTPISGHGYGPNRENYLQIGGEAVSIKSFRQTLSGAFTVRTSTCSQNTGNLSRVVTLPEMRSSQLSSAGQTAGRTPFTLSLTHCATGGAGFVIFEMTGSPDANRPIAFANTGTATGVAINIGSTSDGELIGANGTNNVRGSLLENEQASLNLFAEYVATGAAVKAGTVNSRAQVNFTYH